jgi:hypothetical protein
MRRLLLLFLAGILAASSAKSGPCPKANAQSHPTGEATQARAVATTQVPIQLYWGYVTVVKGSIGDLHNLDLEIDTGAYPSVIDERVACKLGLPEQAARVNLSKKTMDTRLVVLPSLCLGPLRAEQLPVIVQDLSYFQKVLGHKIDGIVGLDLLRKSSFTINYRTKEIIFGPIGVLAFSAAFDTEMPVVTIRTRFQNQFLRLVVDTGSPDLMLLRSRTAEFTGLPVVETEKVDDASGTFQRTGVRVPEVYLGEESIGSQMTFVVQDQKDKGDDFDGILGIRGPQFRKIAFDFERRRFWWER